MVDLNKGGVKFGKVQNHLHKKMLTARQNQTTAGRAQFLRNSILIVVVENCLKVLLSGFFEGKVILEVHDEIFRL